MREIAALFGVTRHAIYLRLKEIGVKRRERGRPGLTFARETLVRLYFIEELPKKEIALKKEGIARL